MTHSRPSISRADNGLTLERVLVLFGLPEALARLRAYANAGADCLYAPGLRTVEQIRALVDAVAPKPVNLLVGAPGEFTLQKIAALGVRRVSVGGALAHADLDAVFR
jgi:2-methylisocitrate lyase-like PEP mutase family enzyme